MENPSIPEPAECGESSTHASEINPGTQAQTSNAVVDPITQAHVTSNDAVNVITLTVEPTTQPQTQTQPQPQTYTAEQRQMIEAEVSRLKKQKVAPKRKGSRKIKHIIDRQDKALKVKVTPTKAKAKGEISCVHCAHLNWSSMFRMKELEYLKERVDTLKNEKKTLEEQLSERDNELRELRSQSGTIQTRSPDGREFSSDLRQTIFHCLENSVHPHKVQTVIGTAVKILAKKELSNFPNKKAVTAMLRELERVQERGGSGIPLSI